MPVSQRECTLYTVPMNSSPRDDAAHSGPLLRKVNRHQSETRGPGVVRSDAHDDEDRKHHPERRHLRDESPGADDNEPSHDSAFPLPVLPCRCGDLHFPLGPCFQPGRKKYFPNHFLTAQTKVLSGCRQCDQKYFLATKVSPDSGDKNVARNHSLATFVSLERGSCNKSNQ